MAAAGTGEGPEEGGLDRRPGVVSTRARFGFTAAAGTTDDARIRDITQALSPQWADRLFTAHEQGANEQQLQQIAADGLAQMYFRANNSRATASEWSSPTWNGSTSSCRTPVRPWRRTPGAGAGPHPRIRGGRSSATRRRVQRRRPAHRHGEGMTSGERRLTRCIRTRTRTLLRGLLMLVEALVVRSLGLGLLWIW
ncbi:telomere-protecting terminal protein Tpg [Streptomyces sp. NPDC056638]|uniref:telomere-protecting terminal protein Tpg n=1 Tax=Streptomyces sp. NPDC056638 TaxID=3345887 RepID=UPI0036853801